MNLDSPAAFRELLDALGELDQSFLTGDRAVGDETGVAQGYRALLTGLGVALDTYLYADPARPQLVEVNTPSRRDRRWGGDNTDAHYRICPIDPERRYRVTGQRGDSVYFSLTAYNEPTPGQWSDRVVGLWRDDELEIGEDGTFTIELGPLPGAACLMTRDYQLDPVRGLPVSWAIECLDPAPPPVRDDEGTAAALRAATTWLRTLFAIIPMATKVREPDHGLGHSTSHEVNGFAAPYQVPDASFGWSARDACYAFGSFDLAEDEALVITHRPPDCRFWNFVVWDQFMATRPADEGRCSVNIGSAVPDEDGRVTIVLARGEVDHPNAVTSLGSARGTLAFRWFLADAVPDAPEVRVVGLADLEGLTPGR